MMPLLAGIRSREGKGTRRAMGGPPNGPQKGGPPPWINPEIQQEVALRDGDIWISVPAKSGTNWMMNIVHQLLTGGAHDFDSIYSVVPWPEYVERPGQPRQEVLDRLAAMSVGARRAFKSHSAPPELPFVKAGQGKDVKYIAVCRNPEEALVSFKIFLDNHTDAFFDMWKVPRTALTRPGFEAFYREVIDAKGMQGMFYGFLASWWPLRHEPNVLLLHYADIKRGGGKILRRISDFLGTAPTETQWAAIEKHTSFDWMKANETKFEILPGPVQPLASGAMIRKGKTGAAREDGMTDQIAAELRVFGSRIVSDPAVLHWLYEGGALPSM
jgi:aryl sulfotransferase